MLHRLSCVPHGCLVLDGRVTSSPKLRSWLSAADHRARAELRAARLRRSLTIQPRDDLVVVGDLAYGGYRVPVATLGEDSVVYTVGVGEDIRFDLALIARLGCTIYAMDPVPRSAQYARAAAAHEPRFIFHQLALWSRDETLTFHAPRQPNYVSHSAVNLFGTEEAFQAEGRALRSLMKEWGHDHIDLLKISAEGSEFEILETLLRDGPVVPILCAEFTLQLDRARLMLQHLHGAGYELVSAKVVPPNWSFTWLHTSESPVGNTR
jgi:FkbM family methyltransferase